MRVEPNVQTLRRAPVSAAPPAAAAPALDRAGPRALLAGPLVAIVSLVAALVACAEAGIPLRDPDSVAGRRLVIVFAVVGALFVLDVVVRAARAERRARPSRAAMAAVRQERWTRRRIVAAVTALVAFYVTYLAYRNLKSVVPLVRPGDLFDEELADLDRALFLGTDPADLLHGLLGTGLSIELLSLAYGLFFLFIPGTLAAAVVWSANLRAGLFYVTALSLNWLLGAASYLALPALGPVYHEPEKFDDLPSTGVSRLQDLLLEQRTDFVADPGAGGAQSIAAFSSLHVSIFATGVIAAHLLGLPRRLVAASWAMLFVTALATIALGWHYVLDDVAGLLLAALAIALAWALTGVDPRREGRVRA